MKKGFVLSLLLVFFLAGCGAQEEPETEMAPEQPKKAPEAEQYTKPIMQDPIERDKNPIVVMETNQGTMEIELFWKETPKIAETDFSDSPLIPGQVKALELYTARELQIVKKSCTMEWGFV